MDMPFKAAVRIRSSSARRTRRSRWVALKYRSYKSTICFCVSSQEEGVKGLEIVDWKRETLNRRASKKSSEPAIQDPRAPCRAPGLSIALPATPGRGKGRTPPTPRTCLCRRPAVRSPTPRAPSLSWVQFAPNSHKRSKGVRNTSQIIGSECRMNSFQ